MTEYNRSITSETIDGAWDYWYNLITAIAKESNKVFDSRDGAVVGEVINAVTVIKDPTRCILKSPVRQLPMRYLVGELLWYMSGKNTLESIQTITHAWDRMSDDGKTVNSNYGYIIQHAQDFNPDKNNTVYTDKEFNQLEMCEELLRKDPNTRQALIHIKSARNVLKNPTKDLNCTVCLQFFIRENKLYLTTYMRSNDLWMGFPNDVFQFTAMQIYLAMKLGVGVGSYTHIAGSLHLYERDYNKSLENIVKIKAEEGKLKAGSYPSTEIPCGMTSYDYLSHDKEYEGEAFNDR